MRFFYFRDPVTMHLSILLKVGRTQKQAASSLNSLGNLPPFTYIEIPCVIPHIRFVKNNHYYHVTIIIVTHVWLVALFIIRYVKK